MGRGVDLLKNNEYAKALPHFEKAAQEGNKRAAVTAGWLHLIDNQLPPDVQSARKYYELALRLESGRHDQYLDYHLPQLEALIKLADDDEQNDREAISILRGDRYSEHPLALRILAISYAFGKGTDKNLKISKLLLERAQKYDSAVHSSHHYAWWLAVHPDAEYRNGKLALALMERVMADQHEAKRAKTLDSLAAAYAANGMFEKAAATQEKALDQLLKESLDYPNFEKWRMPFECRLTAYRHGQAWHHTTAYMPFGNPYFNGCDI